MKRIIYYLGLLALTIYQTPTQAMMLTGNVAEITYIREPGVVGLDLKVPVEGYPWIQTVFSGSPAAEVGLHKGDVLIKIDGQLTLGKNAKAIDEAISDIPGTPVTFTVKRGETYKSITLVVAPLSQLKLSTHAYYEQPTVANAGTIRP